MRPKYFNSLIYLIIALLITSCEMQADLENTIDYKDSDISFTMPGNWKITENVDNEEIRYLFVETTGDALLMLDIFPRKEPSILRDYVESIVGSSIDNFPVGKRDKGSIIKTQTVVDGNVFNGYKNQFLVSLLGVEVPHISYFYYFESDSKVAYLTAQVASEDIDKVQAGFELTLSTLKLQ